MRRAVTIARRTRTWSVPAGTVRLTLDGAALPAGVYVVRVRAEGWQGEQRVTIVR